MFFLLKNAIANISLIGLLLNSRTPIQPPPQRGRTTNLHQVNETCRTRLHIKIVIPVPIQQISEKRERKHLLPTHQRKGGVLTRRHPPRMNYKTFPAPVRTPITGCRPKSRGSQVGRSHGKKTRTQWMLRSRHTSSTFTSHTRTRRFIPSSHASILCAGSKPAQANAKTNV